MAAPGRPLESTLAWHAVLAGVGVALACVQSVVAAAFGARFDVSVAAVVFFALELEVVPGIILTSIVAQTVDLLGGAPPGSIALGLVAAFLGIRLLLRRNVARLPPVIIGTTVLGFLIAAAARTLAHATLGPHLPAPTESGARLLICALAALPVYGLMRRLGDPFRPRDEIRMRR